MATTLLFIFSDGSQVETTDEHPLYVEGQGFKAAKEVGIGTSIVTRAGPSLRVTHVEHREGTTLVYNLTVEGFHTYFVGNNLWVHNTGPGSCGGGGGGEPGPENPPRRPVTNDTIRDALKDSTVKTTQKSVSRPAVERYVRMLEDAKAGDTAPAIKMDGDVIVDGNHRYVAGRVFGQEPPVVPGTGSPSQIRQARPVQDLIIDPFDWGNH